MTGQGRSGRGPASGAGRERTSRPSRTSRLRDGDGDGHQHQIDPGAPRGGHATSALNLLAPTVGAAYAGRVRVIARRALREFWERHPDAEGPLRAWFHDAERADWRGPADLKRAYASASVVSAQRIVFNIRGNRPADRCGQLRLPGLLRSVRRARTASTTASMPRLFRGRSWTFDQSDPRPSPAGPAGDRTAPRREARGP